MEQNLKTCTNCGQAIAADDQFCPNCGVKFINHIPNSLTGLMSEESDLTKDEAKQLKKEADHFTVD